MKKCRPVYEGEDGWSPWIPPIHKGYKLACCSCGLVHDIEFKVVKPVDEKHGGWFRFRDIKTNHRVMFRARRNKKATKVQRKKK